MTANGRYTTLVRFLVVGGVLTPLYAVLAALATSSLPLPKGLSSALVWIAFIPIGFWCQRRFTFPTRTLHRHGVCLYGVTQALGICIAATVSYLLATGVFRLDLVVHLLASGLAAVASYALNRRYTFPQD